MQNADDMVNAQLTFDVKQSFLNFSFKGGTT